MFYFLSAFSLITGFLIFTTFKGLKLKFRECFPSIISYSFFLFLLLICVLYNQIDIPSLFILLVLSGIAFWLIFTSKRLNLYILTLKSYYLFLVAFLMVFSVSEIIFNSNLYIIIEGKFLFFIIFLISILIYSLFEGLLFYYFDKEKLDYLFSSLNTFIPSSMFILLISKNCSLIYVLLFSRHSLLVTGVILASTLLEIYFGIFAMVGISKAYTLSIYKHKNNILNMQYNLQMANLNQLEEYHCDIRRISHDINNHKTVMYKLISDGANDEALNYLESYGEGFSKRKYELLTNNKILNAILLSKKDVCESNEIKLEMDIAIPKNFGVSDFDLCIIIGNLMDNAIEACKKVEEGSFIKIKCAILNDNFVFDMKNSFNGNIAVNKDRFLTSKGDKLNHGLGISNIKSTVNKYGGTCSLTFEGEVFSSFVMIPVELNN
ncbi:MAG: sensor histidine kinase [Clostridium sp.]